ncbi:17951_t:CDS:2 [Acaulospora morrowiae]|uniref:17951_t:CDS:1 n=1 Tax=Acaulospora morrowiae TaxID=94023 RepID=A0A9N9AIK7_9GLOM|nr:17951_t:CDS:2 [Acaulospora morrowiae]
MRFDKNVVEKNRGRRKGYMSMLLSKDDFNDSGIEAPRLLKDNLDLPAENSGNSVSIGEKVVRSKSTSVFGHERIPFCLLFIAEMRFFDVLTMGPANYYHRVEERAVATNNM